MAGLIPKFANLRLAAQEALPKGVFDYIDGGSDDEITLQRNREAWRSLCIVPRVLKNVNATDTSCLLFGEKLDAPLLIAPMALHGYVNKEGECATARAAENCGIPLCVSMFCSKDIEDIRETGSKAILYQQLYPLRESCGDEGIMTRYLKNFYRQGCRCVVLTVDAPVMGRREKDIDNNLDEATFALSKKQNWKKGGGPGENFFQLFADEILDYDWSIVSRIKSIVNVKVLLKGILSPLDAALAVEHGADGIVVSNHGGRQLDTSVTAVDVLPQIVKVVDKRIPILVDGGIQRGTDILKALAMGASAVMIGRPVLYALASGGTEQVETILRDIKEQFAISLRLCGLSSVKEITRDILFEP